MCEETRQPLPEKKEAWPLVLVGVSIAGPSPFLLEMLEKVTALDYPTERMGLFVHNEVGREGGREEGGRREGEGGREGGSFWGSTERDILYIDWLLSTCSM